MKYYLLFILCFLLALPAFCQVVEDDNIIVAKTGADRMRDIPGVRVVVEKLGQQYKEVGFDETKINAFVSDKLRENDCLSPEADPYLYVNINPIQVDEQTFAASIHISLNRPVYYPAENKTFISMATLWQTGSIITFPADSLDYIYDVLEKLMDKFVIEWYKSQIPYKPEAPAVEKKQEAPKEEPKQEGVAPDETTLKHKGLKLAKIDNQNIGE